MAHSVGQSVISVGACQGLVKSVLPTTLIRYHFFVGVPGGLRIELSTKAAHAAPLEAVDRVSLVSDFLWKHPADNCQRRWDLGDAVTEIVSVSFSIAVEPSPWFCIGQGLKCLEPLEPFG